MGLHWTYVLYIVMCAMQLPLLLALLASGWHAECELLQPRLDLSVVSAMDTNNNNTRLVVFERARRSMDPEILGTAVLAGAWSVAYMMLTTLVAEPGRDADDADPSAFLMQPDASLSETPVVGEEPVVAHRAIQVVRVCFWWFVGMQGLVLTRAVMAPVPRVPLPSAEEDGPWLFENSDLWLMALLRSVALFGLCRTAPWEKGTLAQVWAAAVYVGWVVTCLHPWLCAARHWAVTCLWVVQTAGLDALLVISHEWDRIPSMHVVLHCRLCYVALSSSLAQLFLLLLPGN